jgi:hypothetical protein
MRVPVSEKNPSGITIRDRHLRRLNGTYLTPSDIELVFKNYNRKGIPYPQQKRLTQPNSDKYYELIAVWCVFPRQSA